MEIKLNVPDYLSVKHWKQFVASEHLEPSDKMVSMLSILTDRTKDEIKEFKTYELTQVYNAVLKSLTELEPQFYPIFELDDVLYGFTSITSLTLGEYVDLETR